MCASQLYTLYLERCVCDVVIAPLSEITQCVYCVALCTMCSKKDFETIPFVPFLLFSHIYNRIDVQSFKAYLIFSSPHHF